ncbi:MAG: hypothetical protein ACO4CH_05210, partial [Saprospiraceae bacterium]
RKKEIFRAYMESGLEKQKLRKLFDFMKAYTPFRNSDLELTFEQDLRSFSNTEEAMGITETILHEVEKKGMEKGMEKGFSKAIHFVIIRGHQNGMSVSELSDQTGLSEQEVSEILRSENGAGQ